jgi:hypothetical protein
MLAVVRVVVLLHILVEDQLLELPILNSVVDELILLLEDHFLREIREMHVFHLVEVEVVEMLVRLYIRAVEQVVQELSSLNGHK